MPTKPGTSAFIVIAAICIQAIALIFEVTLPFGFDHTLPGQIDFSYRIVIAAMYLLALLVGLVAGAYASLWKCVVGQILVLCAIGLFFAIAFGIW